MNRTPADGSPGSAPSAEEWAGLSARARAGLAADPDPRTRTELSGLLNDADSGSGSAAAARAEIADRFAGTLQFGTAGLRGELGAGPNRMNRAVVIATASGLADWLTVRVSDARPRIVIGFDARHGSDTFARDSAAVFTAAGSQVWLLPRPLPTPVLAFAVRQLGADAGVMVTASHNPRQDNGYKVYLGGRIEPGPGNGVQLVAPADAQIADRIAAVGAASSVPRATTGWTVLDDEIVDRYLAGATSVVARSGRRDLATVFTALHGVGGELTVRAFTGAGFTAPYLVASQAEPDPDFPTVAFPNPEEPGALDLAIATARERDARLVLAQDPDADRCAVAVPDPALPAAGGRTGWRRLHGDELGALLAEHLLSRSAEVPTPADGPPPVVACSIVSSQLLGKIAQAHGVHQVETLTGFKWIARVPGLVYGYEEALGYCVAPSLVRDKDGITAALLVAELASQLAAANRTLLDALDDLARRHGVHATDQLSVRVPDVSLIGAMMTRLRAEPPRRLAGAEITEIDDLRDGGPGLPPTDGLRWRTADGTRVVVRPSGTEPKLKCYLEVVLPPGEDLAADRRAAADRLTRMRTALQGMLTPPRQR